MGFLNDFLPILLYLAGFVLLIVLIIVCIKLINILDKVDKVVDDVNNKVSSFDSAIATFSKTANGLANISNSVVFGLTSAVSKIFHKKFKEEDE